MATDIVKTGGQFNWKFIIDSPTTGFTELSWPQIRTGSQELYLYDGNLFSLTNMLETNTYSFESTKGNSFMVYFGNNVLSSIKPPALGIGNPYPNPVAEDKTSNFNIALPESPTDYNVSLQVYSSTGMLVGNQIQTMEAGLHQLKYTFDQNTFSSGLYVYRVVIGSGEKSTVSTGKISMP